jgi:crotonobetainyl-CoA:carnitine CoA-transferase CaiB-like acyl-CoA transferase
LLETIRQRLRNRPPKTRRAVEREGLPFAPIRKPKTLRRSASKATGGLADVRLPDGDRAGQTVKTALFPITLEGQRLGVRLDPPRLGEHTRELLGSVGYTPQQIEALLAEVAVA